MLRHLLFWLLPPITLYFPTYTYFRQFWVKSQRSITLNNSKTRNGRVHICHSTRCWKSHLASDNYDSRGHFKSEKPAETLLLWVASFLYSLNFFTRISWWTKMQLHYSCSKMPGFWKIRNECIFNQTLNSTKNWYLATVQILTKAQKLGCLRQNQFQHKLWDVPQCKSSLWKRRP